MRHRLFAVIAALGVALLPAVVAAHPLGNFTVNRYIRVEPGAEATRVKYILDFAEVPAFQESSRIDLDRNGRLDAAERAAYLDLVAPTVTRGLFLAAGGKSLPLAAGARSLELLPGQGGLDTMRIELQFEAPGVADGAAVQLRDATPYMERVGWREIVVVPGAGRAAEAVSLPNRDLSQELRVYPEDLLQTPPDHREVRFTAVAAAGTAAPSVAVPPALGRSLPTGDPLVNTVTGFLRDQSGGAWAVVAALAVSVALGALHALGPGHGKGLVGAYLVGSRGTWKHAVFLGMTVTVTHTAGVYALGLVALFAAGFILPEQLYPILGGFSGLAVVAIGVSLFRSRLRALRAPAAVDHDHADLDLAAQAHAHGGAIHDHAHGADHQHLPPVSTAAGRRDPYEWSRQYARATIGQRSFAMAAAQPGMAVLDLHAPAAASANPAGFVHVHDGGAVHSHLPPGADGQKVTIRSLLALGISGGLLPCPSALVVLLAAIAVGNIALGMLLVAAFSVGLAGVLTGIGLALVFGGRLASRHPAARRLASSPLVRFVPVASAVAITLAGAYITWQAVFVNTL